MSEEQNDEWIVVGKPKRKKIKKEERVEEKVKSNKIVWEVGKPAYLIENENADVENFINSESFSGNKGIVREKINAKAASRKNLQIHIECLGLGDFMKYSKPRYQYFLLTKMLIPLCHEISSEVTVNCYDPVFSEECLKEIKRIGGVKADNIPIQKENLIIILYMPHCERFLHERYCQVYSKNEVIVIGNSLREYQNRCELIGEKVPEEFLNRKLMETKIKDFRESLNDTFCYFI